MATINVNLRTDKKANEHGEYPLMIRLYYKKTMYPYTFSFKVHSKFWNEDTQQVKPTKFYDDYGRMNHIINQKKQRAEMLMEKWVDDDGVDPEVMREIISLDLKEQKRDPSVDIISFCDDVADQFEKENRMSSSNNYRNLKSKLKEFTGDDYLTYEGIDSYFIEEFFDWLKHEKINKRTGEAGLAHNTAYKSIEYLKAMYRKAQKRFRNIRKDDPFFYFDESPEETTIKYLDKDEFEKFKNIEAESANAKLIKDMFIFSVYACGMRFSDVFRLKWDQIDFIENTVEFVAYKNRRKKTGKFINPILEQGLEILEKYREKNGDKEYIFDWCNETNLPIETDEGLHKAKRSFQVRCSKTFKNELSEKIGKHTHFHMSRHTFANLVRRSGMSKVEINEIFDHSDLKTTEIYLDKFVNKDNTGKRSKLESALSAI